MLQEGGRGRRRVREHPRQNTTNIQSITKGETGGFTKEGDKEAPTVARPDKDVGDDGGDQGQEASPG